MNLIEQLKNASGREFELLLFGIAGLLSPGLIAIWYFAPDFYAQTSTLKLAMSACALTAPFVGLNALLIVFRPIGILRAFVNDDEAFSISVTFGAIGNALLGTVLLIITYFASLSLRTFIAAALFAQLIVVLTFVRFGHSRLDRERS
jgi:energy-converting hydrogenase Eha subunit E